jgi:hypothetical protein
VPRSITRGAIPPLPNTPSRHGAQLKHGENFTFLPDCLYKKFKRYRTSATALKLLRPYVPAKTKRTTTVVVVVVVVVYDNY